MARKLPARPGRLDGRSLRYLIAIGIALFGVIGYYAKRTRNPVTGEMQSVNLTVDQEKALGLKSAPEMARQMGGEVSPSDPAARLVTDIGTRVMQQSDAYTSPYRDNFHFHLLADDKTVNAFALPGGQIFITRALLVRLENEAQLAGVLGHEIGHVIHRHSAEHMAKGQLGQSIATAVGVAGSDDRGGQGAYMAAQVANQMMQLRYSRGDELEADSAGLKYITQAGFDPSEMINVMQILKKASGGGGHGPDFMQTHPDPDARIEAIKKYLAEKYPNGVPANLSKGRPFRARGDDR
jgi:predicted Zn-dependent protease